MQLRGIIVLSFAAALAFAGIAATNRPRQTDRAPLGVLSVQLAGAPARAGEVVESWDATARIFAAFNIGLNYLFLVASSLLLALACSYVATRPGMLQRGWVATGAILAWAMLLAGLFDALENAASLTLLLQPSWLDLGIWIRASKSADLLCGIFGPPTFGINI
jgi:hypothetical protein